MLKCLVVQDRYVGDSLNVKYLLPLLFDTGSSARLFAQSLDHLILWSHRMARSDNDDFLSPGNLLVDGRFCIQGESIDDLAKLIAMSKALPNDWQTLEKAAGVSLHPSFEAVNRSF